MLEASSAAIETFGPVFEHAFDDEPSMNGSDETKGWGQNYSQKVKFAQKNEGKKDIVGPDMIGDRIHDFVNESQDVHDSPRASSPDGFAQKAAKAKDVSPDHLGWNVYDTVFENVSDIAEPRAVSAAQKNKFFGMSPQSEYAIQAFGPALEHE